MKGKDKGSSGSGGGSSSQGSTEDGVVVLDATNFEALVMKSKDIWIV